MTKKIMEVKNIKFRKVRSEPRFNISYMWKGRKGGFLFSLSKAEDYGISYYAAVSHKTKDIRFNSLWSNITFAELQDAFDWCNTFEYKNFACLGKDVDNPQQHPTT